ncbi:MAG TPA: MFS transporter, partial [Ornithinicoccus sp.]|nr:MFS transporter [Ornithinicoccus sp.]
VSALVLSTIRAREPAPASTADRHLGRELVEGARWVYQHPTLLPYAVGLHTWFFFNSAVLTILVFYASEELGLDPVAIGLVLASAGVSGVVGAGLAPRLSERFGLGLVVCLAGWTSPLAFVLVALAPTGGTGLLVLVAGQLLYGVGNGVRGPLEMSYRNAATPDRLRARMNATIRSFNWGTITVSAPLAGWFAVTYGNRSTILVCVLGLAVAALIPTVSPFLRARMPEGEPDLS